jgi:hypothetical protein
MEPEEALQSVVWVTADEKSRYEWSVAGNAIGQYRNCFTTAS